VFEVVESEKEARLIVAERSALAKSQAQSKKKMSLEDLFANVKAGEAQELNLIVKADVQGSLDPIVSELNKLGEGEIGIKILYAETGNIGDNDVMLASASNAIIIGFNVQADVSARRLAEKEGVDIRLYEIIYRMTGDIEKPSSMLEPETGKGYQACTGAGGIRPQIWQSCRLPGDGWRAAPQCQGASLSRHRPCL
jgi:translation initiation factor IF-2